MPIFLKIMSSLMLNTLQTTTWALVDPCLTPVASIKDRRAPHEVASKTPNSKKNLHQTQHPITQFSPFIAPKFRRRRNKIRANPRHPCHPRSHLCRFRFFIYPTFTPEKHPPNSKKHPNRGAIQSCIAAVVRGKKGRRIPPKRGSA